jgi:hypothetical protein
MHSHFVVTLLYLVVPLTYFSVIAQTVGWAKPDPIHKMTIHGGRVYPLSPQINPPLALVKEESNTRGESRVTLGGNETKSETMEVMPL